MFPRPIRRRDLEVFPLEVKSTQSGQDFRNSVAPSGLMLLINSKPEQAGPYGTVDIFVSIFVVDKDGFDEVKSYARGDPSHQLSRVDVYQIGDRLDSSLIIYNRTNPQPWIDTYAAGMCTTGCNVQYSTTLRGGEVDLGDDFPYPEVLLAVIKKIAGRDGYYYFGRKRHDSDSD